MKRKTTERGKPGRDPSTGAANLYIPRPLQYLLTISCRAVPDCAKYSIHHITSLETLEGGRGLNARHVTIQLADEFFRWHQKTSLPISRRGTREKKKLTSIPNASDIAPSRTEV